MKMQMSVCVFLEIGEKSLTTPIHSFIHGSLYERKINMNKGPPTKQMHRFSIFQRTQMQDISMIYWTIQKQVMDAMPDFLQNKDYFKILNFEKIFRKWIELNKATSKSKVNKGWLDTT